MLDRRTDSDHHGPLKSRGTGAGVRVFPVVTIHTLVVGLKTPSSNNSSL